MRHLTARQQQLLQLLSDGEFHSGEQIGQQLAISRAAISQQIKQLKPLGLDVYSVTGRGYRLAHPLELLDPKRLTASGVDLFHCIAVIDSTNQYMMSRLNEWQQGECLLAECQTAGRGRRGREWVSPFAGQLIMSLYWQLDQGMAAAMGLSLVVGIVIAEVLREHGYDGIGLKWPNDVYGQGQKLAGILVEMAATAGGACQLVIGAGLNLAMPIQLAEQISQPWTALQTLRATPVARNQLTADIILQLRAALQQFERTGLTSFVARWNQFDIYRDQPVRLLLGDREVTGVARGIDLQGALLLECDGEVMPFIGGEISLRPVV